MTASDAKVIINSLLESTEANDIMHSLPEYDKTGTYVSNPNLSDDEVKEIYNTFREEIKNVSMTDYLNTVISSHTVTSLDLYDNEASTPSSTQLYLTSATPNAFSLYMKYYNEHNQNSFDEKLSTALNSTDDYRAYLTAYIYDYADNTVYYATDRDSSGSDRDLLIYADSILDEAAVPIPENFKENFNPETCYICLMYPQNKSPTSKNLCASFQNISSCFSKENGRVCARPLKEVLCKKAVIPAFPRRASWAFPDKRVFALLQWHRPSC